MYTRSITLFSALLFLSLNLLHASPDKPKMLHISFHIGCVKDIETVAQELNVDVTSWYIHSSEFSRDYFDGKFSGNAIYNMSHRRAQRVWDLHKDYFNQFDIIMTSDTAPLSRIFLQNNWKKPLIIWVCNRFDYHDGASSDGEFPDREYYELFKRAAKQKNVKVIGYTEYEHHYAATKGVNTGGFTITPIGAIEESMREGMQSFIPDTIEKDKTVFIYPRLDDNQLRYIKDRCKEVGIKTYSGKYNGPYDLQQFKGVIYFPYQFSNLALFEDMLRGIVHFVPSERFIQELVGHGAPVRYCMLNNFHFVEWYNAEHRSSIVYFDSWQDLKHKVETLDYDAMSATIKKHAQEYRQTMLARWQHVFDELNSLLK